jgi:hypothetical protein
MYFSVIDFLYVISYIYPYTTHSLLLPYLCMLF